MAYWLVSLPLLDNSRDRTWSTLQQKTTYDNDWAVNFKFDMPELRVGTLDSLMTLSDDLVKVAGSLEGVVGKIRRTIVDVCGAPSGPAVDGRPVDSYLTDFRWDEAKYPSRRSLQETVGKIQEEMLKLDDDLKVRVAEYTALKTSLQGAQRKTQGNLLVRDLNAIVKPSHVVESDNLTTLIVVVSKFAHADWLANYETLTGFVVPRSSQVVASDNDYVMVTATLFHRIADDFRAECRSRGYTVREFAYDAKEKEAQAAEFSGLQTSAAAKLESLSEWCSSAFGDAFSSWIHVCAVRLFCESILRYGLPPQFMPVLMKPSGRAEAKLRGTLSTNFGASGGKYWKVDAKEDVAIGYDGEYQPYVSFSISLD